jgi:putative tRNA adenosine deaminase-associated protein
VPYFTAVLSRDGRAWTFHDLDVDSQSSLTGLTADLRGVADDDQPVLLLVEREDAWWAVVRVDGDDDPRVFVSDIAGAVASPYAELLAVADEEDEDLAPGVCGGDLDLLSDLGTSPESLREMCDDQLLPMDALAAVAEAGGFAEQLDSLR